MIEAPLEVEPIVRVVLVPAVSDTTLAWSPRDDVVTVAEVATEVMPRRQMKVMSWPMSEVSLTVAVRTVVSQVGDWTVMRLRPRTPSIGSLVQLVGEGGEDLQDAWAAVYQGFAEDAGEGVGGVAVVDVQTWLV